MNPTRHFRAAVAPTPVPSMPRTAAEARASGSKLYFTGKVCPQGHVAPRRLSGGACTECDNERRGVGRRNETAAWLNAHEAAKRAAQDTMRSVDDDDGAQYAAQFADDE